MGAKARAKEAGPGAISPAAAGSAGGEAEMKTDVAMPLAPRAGAVGKGKKKKKKKKHVLHRTRARAPGGEEQVGSPESRASGSE